MPRLTTISTLVNNLAASFAQHPVHNAFQVLDTASPGQETPSSSEPASPADARTAHLDAARRWATNANYHATQTQGEQRTPECDEACAVSLCNLGDIASMSGDASEARRRFEQCIAMSKKLGFSPGVAQAEEGLRQLKKLTATSG